MLVRSDVRAVADLHGADSPNISYGYIHECGKQYIYYGQCILYSPW